MPDRTLAVVLASGGVDSSVTAAMAAEGHDVAMLHVSYGQRTEERERQAFQAIADHVRARHRLAIRMNHLSSIGGSSLTDPAIPVARADLHRSGIPSSYVPFRNATLLSAAVSWAEVLGAGAVYIGAVEEDSSGYPDCREGFFEAFRAVIATGTRPDARIALVTPVLHMSKAEIVRRGHALGVPFDLTWSCYSSEDVACGICDSCALRLRAFAAAGIVDPIPYHPRPAKL